MRFIEIVSPVKHLLPEVEPTSVKRILFRDKLIWTAITLVIYLICCQIPLYGVTRMNGMDPLYQLRIVFASKKGTLMEQGIAPIIISSTILHTLAGKRWIDINMGGKGDRELYQAFQKMLSFLITLVQAVLCLYGGMYGPVESLGLLNQVMIIFQLCMAGIILILLDELLQKGYGLGNGISLFTAANIFGAALWQALAFTSVQSPQGTMEFEGAIPFFLHSLVRWNGVLDSFTRAYGPNLVNLASTVIIYFTVNFY